MHTCTCISEKENYMINTMNGLANFDTLIIPCGPVVKKITSSPSRQIISSTTYIVYIRALFKKWGGGAQ